ncbi:MAG: rhodanese-like domain-containing protein [SAR324 cluster bacterium]|nr:rhodanese-like domain-containing protein [SAR324 cluster bacterium]
MTPIDQKWVVPLLFLSFIGLIAFTNYPAHSTWYDSIEDYQINTIDVEELAAWIIQGRNHYMPILLDADSEQELDNIPGLIRLQHDETLEDKVASLSTYKKWIVITSDGNLPSPTAAILTKDWRRRIILLKGGVKEWHARISAESIADLPLSLEEEIALKNVRPFFHKNIDSPTESDDANRYIAPAPTAPPLLIEEEEVEEEGC